ncbi:MAG: MopE-related protein, partial [Thalassolituus sp.]
DDNDTISDADEIAAGSDPLNIDSTPEIDDGSDNDLDGEIDEGFDADGDGFTPIGGSDCNDSDTNTYMGAEERFDDIDNDCDGLVDEDFTDTDNDGQHDGVDTDDDNDGVPDVEDAFPLNAEETADTDGDGTGNNADADDDNDGYTDDVEIQEGTDPLNGSSTPADLDGDYIPDSTDSDVDGDGFSNDEEIAAGTDPYNGGSQPLDMIAVLEQGTYYYLSTQSTEEDGTELITFQRYVWLTDGNGNSGLEGQNWTRNMLWETQEPFQNELTLLDDGQGWRHVDYTNCEISAIDGNTSAVTETCNGLTTQFSYSAVDLNGQSVTAAVNALNIYSYQSWLEETDPATLFSEGDTGYILTATPTQERLIFWPSCYTIDGTELCQHDYVYNPEISEEQPATSMDMLMNTSSYHCDAGYLSGSAADGTGPILSRAEEGVTIGQWNITEFGGVPVMSFICTGDSERKDDVYALYNGVVVQAELMLAGEGGYTFSESEFDFNPSAAAKIDEVIAATFPIITYQPYQPPQYDYAPADFPAALSDGLTGYDLDSEDLGDKEVAEAKREVVEFNAVDQITIGKETLNDSDEWIARTGGDLEIRLIEGEWTVVDHSMCAASVNADDSNKLNANCAGEASLVSADVADFSGSDVSAYIGYLAAQAYGDRSYEFSTFLTALESVPSSVFP